MNQPSSSSAGGSGAEAVAGAAVFLCVIVLGAVVPGGMLLGAVKDRKQINVCQIRTCTCIYSKKNASGNWATN